MAGFEPQAGTAGAGRVAAGLARHTEAIHRHGVGRVLGIGGGWGGIQWRRAGVERGIQLGDEGRQCGPDACHGSAIAPPLFGLWGR